MKNSIRRFSRRLILGGLALASVVGFNAMALQNLPATSPNLPFTKAGTINAILRLPDGGVIVGGEFSSINGIGRTNLARLGATGTVDQGWMVPVSGPVVMFATNEAGAFVVGSFTNIGGLARRGVAKIDVNSGAVDPVWDAQVAGSVSAIGLNGDDVYLGGSFQTVKGLARTNLVKLSASGAGVVDGNWRASCSGSAQSLVVSGTNLYVGGFFYTLNGANRIGIGRVASSGTGALDSNWTSPFTSGTGISTMVSDNAYLYIGGASTLMRLSLSNGARDTTWTPTPSSGVNILKMLGDKLYVGGYFQTAFGGQNIFNLARISLSSGAPDLTFCPGVDSGVKALAFSGTALYVGGYFNAAGNTPTPGLARLTTSSGIADSAFAARIQIPATVSALATQPDGQLIVGGDFTMVGNTFRSRMVRLTAMGNLDAQWNVGANGPVRALLIHSNDLFVAGLFSTIGQANRNGLAKVSLDPLGTVDPLWDPQMNVDINSRINAMAAAGSSLYVGGYFSRIGGQDRACMAKLSTTASGSADLSWAPQPGAPGGGWYLVTTLAVMGNNVYAGGEFTQIGGLNRQHLAKLSATGNGNADPYWAPNPDRYWALQLVSDGMNLYAGGSFTNIGGRNVSSLAKLNPYGFGECLAYWNFPLRADATAIGLHGTNLYFASYNTLTRVDLLSGTPDPSWTPTPTSINAFAFSGSRVFVGGTFSSICGVPRGSLAAFTDAPPLPVLSNARVSQTGFSCKIAAEENLTLRVQSSTNLTHWTDLQVFSSTNSTVQFQAPGSTSQNFYRVVSP